MSDVRWEPIQGDWYHDLAEMTVIFPDDLGSVEYNDDGDEAWVETHGQQVTLPPDVRLCRAVPVEWSQEPPTEAGQQWWMWRDQWRRFSPNAKPECRMVYYGGDDGELGFDHRILGFVTIEDAHRKWPDTWYMPATVPQPPGEVGP